MEEIEEKFIINDFNNDNYENNSISQPQEEYTDFMKQVVEFINTISVRLLKKHEIEFKIDELSKICNNNFRFQYSSIEATVYKLSKVSEVKSITFLSDNIYNMLNVYFESDVKDNKVFKFCDHILLALNRISYLKETTEEIDASYLEVQGKLELKINDVSEHHNKLSKITEQFKNDVKETHENMQKEIQASKTETITNLVAVLGIFSGLVIAFFGDISMFTSIFGNVSESNFVIMVFFSLLLGLIIVDGICLLLYMTARIADKNNLFTKGSKFASWLTILNVSIIAINFILFFYINPIDFSKIISSLS